MTQINDMTIEELVEWLTICQEQGEVEQQTLSRFKALEAENKLLEEALELSYDKIAEFKSCLKDKTIE